jgi:hypothetical protein
LDVDAVAVEDVGEFHANSAGADDDDGLRYCCVEDLLFVGHDVVAEGDPGQHPHPCAGGDDRVVEADAGGAAVM